MDPVNNQPEQLQHISVTPPQPSGGQKSKLALFLTVIVLIIGTGIFAYLKYMPNQNLVSEIDNSTSQQSEHIPETLNSSTTSTGDLSLIKQEDYGIDSKEGVPWLKGKTITNSPETKSKLAAKYTELWNAFNEKNTQKILNLVGEQLQSYSEATGDTSVKNRLTEDLQSRFSSQNYSLYPIQEALENSELIIAANGKLATLMIENEYSPIFYLRKNPEGSVSYNYYFMLNDFNEFVPIYNPAGREN